MQHGHNRVCAGDGFGHAEDGGVALERVGAESVEEELVERDGLGGEIEDGVRVHAEVRVRGRAAGGGDDFDLFDGRVDGFVVEASAPGAVIGGDCVCVPTRAPEFVGRVVAHVGAARAESILRGDAAHGDVQGMVGEEQVGASGNLLEREAFAALFETRTLRRGNRHGSRSPGRARRPLTVPAPRG